MKYIDADCLRAKIEKYLTFDNNIDTAYYIGRRDAERSILNIIDSLQQEQPEVDIKKIIEQTYHDGSVADTDDIDHVDYENIARHFYELGLNARKEENK